MTKVLNRIILIAAFTAIIFAFPIVAQADGVDSTPPELMEVNILTPSIQAGDTAYIQILVKEEGVGITEVMLNDSNYYSWLEELPDGSTPGPQVSYGENYISYTFAILTSPNTTMTSYDINRIELRDMRGNKAIYKNIDGDLVDSNINSRISGVGSITIAGSSPVVIDDAYCKIKSVSFKENEIVKPGKIHAECSFEKIGDVRDISINITYKCLKDDTTYFDADSTARQINDDTQEITSSFSKNAHIGEWVISSITMYYYIYVDGNSVKACQVDYYLTSDNGWLVNTNDPDNKFKANTFTITGIQTDEICPEINSIKVLKDDRTVMAPGLLPVEIDITEDGSGVVWLYLNVVNDKGENVSAAGGQYSTTYTDYEDFESQLLKQPLKTGKHRLYVPVYSSLLPGEYKVFCYEMIDANDNITRHYAHEEDLCESFTVVSEFDIGFETTITSPGILQMVRDMPEGKAGKIYRAGTNYYIKKEVLDEIAGKDKTLIVDIGDFQWVLSGKEMSPQDTKDLDLNVRLVDIPAYEMGTSNDAVGLVFGKNGKLPKGVQVRFPSIFFNYFLGQAGKLHLYYIKEKSNTNDQAIDLDGASVSEEKDANIQLVSDNGSVWCYLDIAHNSSFIVSGEKLKSTINHFAKKASFAPLMLKSTKQTTSSIKLNWKKVKRAKIYAVYGNVSNSKKRFIKLKTTRNTSISIKKITKRLSKKTYYKFIVVAADSNNKLISASSVIHVSTKGSRKSGNPKGLTVKAKKKGRWVKVNKLAIKRRQRKKLRAKQILPKKTTAKRKLPIRYESSNKKVVTVSKKGVIKGIKKGHAKVYVYTQNGVCKTISVRVK